ncbi:putative monooxygenase [Annulohypoxylon maeteangense]|uniref:putative monooxygenase n=1 Tax=Annulohypoxylon maeteangense TaxID=1927788 RepID=UPI0020082602|nr:putative monooxygenase [Annulohypoxylon maeteangense]KAI0882334.1 putative monooxygenase [Annulohypoxylon maeteangense]
METEKPFRVIVVGCGLIGLTAAHILSKTGIDFTILEKHETVLALQGTTLALWPQTLRIFDQLGLLKALEPSLDYIEQGFTLSAKDARIRMKDETVLLIEKNHGHGIKIMHRPDLVRLLYESLPESVKSLILLKKHVVNISPSEDGVKVVCADGSTHEGSIVIGADGVRSSVRLLMRALKRGKKPEDLPQAQKQPYVATYRLYFGEIPILPGLATNTRYDGSQDGLSTQIVNGTDRGWYGVYEKIDSHTSKATRYTETDKVDILNRCGNLYLAPGWKLQDVNARRLGDTGLINIEEGLIDGWSFERIVLVGDAVRKYEPHAGLGYNSGVTDLVVLINDLRQLLRDDKFPGTRTLQDLFEIYEKKRLKDTRKMAEFSMKTARLIAWSSWKDRVMAKYILPNLPLNKAFFNNTFGPLISETPVLDWLEESVLPKSHIAWKHHPGVQNDGVKGGTKSHNVL